MGMSAKMEGPAPIFAHGTLGRIDKVRPYLRIEFYIFVLHWYHPIYYH